jgi:hypothetical protein
MRSVIIAMACLLCVGQVAYAGNTENGDVQNGSVHHNTTVNVEGGGEVNAAGGSASTSTDVDASASSAAVFLTGCQQGAAAQGLGFGAALGAESALCQRLRLVAAYQALGMHFQAAQELRAAAREMNDGRALEDGQAPDRAFFGWVGYRLRNLFRALPFVGHAA